MQWRNNLAIAVGIMAKIPARESVWREIGGSGRGIAKSQA